MTTDAAAHAATELAALVVAAAACATLAVALEEPEVLTLTPADETAASISAAVTSTTQTRFKILCLVYSETLLL